MSAQNQSAESELTDGESSEVDSHQVDSHQVESQAVVVKESRLADRIPSFSFGLRGLAIAMTIIGAVLGVIRIWGVLGGIGIVAAVTYLLFALVLLAAIGWRIVFGKEVENGRFLSFCRIILLPLVLLFSFLFFTFVLAGGSTSVFRILATQAQQKALQQTYGIQVKPLDMVHNGELRECVEVVAIESGSPFEPIGVRSGDIITLKPAAFFESLARAEKEPVELEIASGGSSGNWEDYQIRSVTLGGDTEETLPE